MKILLTGGAGFIGSHLLEALIARGDSVSVVDDFNDYYDPTIKRSNLPRQGYTLYERDIRDSFDIVAKEKPDVLVHLAARAGVRPSLKDPVLYESVNVGGTVALLEACRKVGVGKVVFASSSSVYGDAEPPFVEDNRTLFPASFYGLTKLMGEECIRSYVRLFGLRATCLRFFTVYGPRQRPDMAIHAFAAAINARREISMYGDGSTERDYTYISDIVHGILGAVDRDEEFAVYNLGGSQTIRLDQLIALLGKFLGKTPIVRRMPEQLGDVRKTCASVAKARSGLGYEPKVSIEAGLREFVNWYSGGKSA